MCRYRLLVLLGILLETERSGEFSEFRGGVVNLSGVIVLFCRRGN